MLVMELKTKLALAGLVAAAALTLWITTCQKGDVDALPDAQSALTRDPLEASAPAREPVNSAELGSAERAPVPGAEAQQAASAPVVARRTLFGVVIDVGGARLTGIPVVFLGEPAARATSGAEGIFAIEVAADGELDVEAPGWVSVYETSVELPDPVEGYCLVLAHPCTIQGFVRDGAGEPVANAQVLFGTMEQGRFDFLSRYSDPLRKRLGLGLEPSTLRSWTTASRADGSFELQAARIPGLPIRASHPAYMSAETDMPEGDQPVTLVLNRDDQPKSSVLAGRVVDLHSKPVHGACLRYGASSARSDEHGNFAIRIDGQAAGARLLAIHCDWEPVVQPCLASSPTDAGAWPDPLLLVMREPVAGIGGVVRDPEGKPLKDVEVLPLDPPSWNEYLGRIGESTIESGDDSDVVLGNEMARTGEDGRFHIRGLAGRSYRLLVRSRRTLEALVSDPIPGGTKDALLVLGGSEGRSRFAGVIVDLQDKPIPGAMLAGIRTLADGTRIDTDWIRSDEQGRFETPEVSSAIEGFLVWPETGPGEFVQLDPAAPRDAQRLQVGRIARVCVRIQTPGLEADSLAFLDAGGKALACGKKIGRGGWMGGGNSTAIDGSQSDVIIVSERARTLVLSSKGKEVQRVPLSLDPAQVNLVRL